MIFRKLLFRLNEKGMRGCAWRAYEEMLKNESLTRAQIEEMQWRKLEKLIRHAYETVPYYRNEWKKANIHPRDIRHFQDFNMKIPMITKFDVRKKLEQFFSEKLSPGLIRVDTSGTGGKPATFYHDRISRSYGLAGRYRGRQWWGVSPVDNEVRFWGRSAYYSPSIKVRTKDKMKRAKDWLLGVKYMSTFNMKEENLEQWLSVIQKHHPKVILGYSSAVYAFSKYLQDHDMNLHNSGIKVVTHTSEPFYSNQKDMVRRFFCKNIASEYGSVENGNIGFECPEGSLHVCDENVYLEIVKSEDFENYIAVTNLENFSFPLIRYNTQDTGTLVPKPCKCGRPLHVMTLDQARMFDYICNSKGDLIDGVSLMHVIDRSILKEKGCRRYRAIQEAPDRIDVYIETVTPLTETGKTLLRSNIQQYVEEKIRVNIYEKEHLSVEPSGKFKFIISRVKK